MDNEISVHSSTPRHAATRVRPVALDLTWAWFRLLHPFPSILVTVSTAGFAEMATSGSAAPGRLALLVASVLCSQGAIGSANDVVDRDLDLVTKPWKPVARGAISVAAAARVALALSACCLVCSALLSGGALLAACCGLGCGLSYDLWLKRSAWSWLPYGLAIPTLPVWSWAAMGQFTWRLLLAYPLGLLLGLALHLANTLPDLEGDAANGVRGFAHRLGRGGSQIFCWVALALCQALTLALAPVIGYHGSWYPAGLAASVALLLSTVVLLRLRPTVATLQINFGLVALASLALAAGWLAGAVV